MDKVKRLNTYAEHLKERLKGTLSSVPLREFIERDLRKTLSVIEKLTK